MADTMDVELFGGPADGMVLQVPEAARVWIVPTPHMTPAEFIALESGQGSAASVFPVADHLYAWTKSFSTGKLLRIFRYAGSRPRPTRSESS